MRLDLTDTTNGRFQRPILVALAVPLESSGGRMLRLLRRPALWITAAAAVVGIELGCLVVALLANFHVIPSVEIPGVCAYIPAAVWLLWLLIYFPQAYLVENLPAFSRLAAQGNRRVVSPVEAQPPLLSSDDLPAVSTSIGPIARAMSQGRELLGDWASFFLLMAVVSCCMIAFVALVFAIILLFLAPLILAAITLAICMALSAGGIWLLRISRRHMGNRRAWKSRPLQLTVTTDGVSWQDGDASATVRREALAWRQVEGFCTVEFQRAAGDGPCRVYLLWSGTSQLAWEWTPRVPIEQRVACDLLVSLAATQTRLPLYDLAPGISTLAAGLQKTVSLHRPRADRALTLSLPPGLAIPLEELGVWNRRLLRVVLGAYALIALWGALAITGSIFGLLAALLVIVAIVVFWRRRRSAAA